MSFWVRELFGWVFIAVGLVLAYLCVAILLVPGPRLIEAPIIGMLAIFIFRGGIHLLKVAIAARVAMRVQRTAEKQETANKGARG
jgi:hypothetical protein